MARELIIYTDESEKDGLYFANFYGGVALWSTDLEEVSDRLAMMKLENNIFGEAKWGSVSLSYLDKYKALVDETFDMMEEGKIRTRVMFTHKVHVATNLTTYHKEHGYHLLYYQFIKHAFGLEYASPANPFKVRLYLDRLPDTHEKNTAFKGFLHSLEDFPQFRRAGIKFPTDQISEVVSHEHVVMQALDVVLGSIQFRLNDKHQRKPPGAHRRGKKTIAKERLYRHVNGRIRKLYPNFNIGISTGQQNDPANRWNHPYRHWCFVPKQAKADWTKIKPKKG